MGFLLVVLASSPIGPASARDLEPPSETGIYPTGPSRLPESLPVAQGDNAHRVRPDDDFQRAMKMAAFDGAPTAPGQEPQQSPAPSSENWQNETADNWFQPLCDNGQTGYLQSCCENPCPSCYLQLGALFLWREPRFSNQPIVVDPNTNTTALSTSALDSDFDPGLQLTFGIPLPGCRVLEFDYFGLFDGDSSAVAVTPGPGAFLTFPGNLAGNTFVDMDRTDITYSYWFNSFALNFPCCCGCCECECGDCCPEYGDCGGCGCGDGRWRGGYGGGEVCCESFTWFAGFRYIDLGERLNIASQRTVAGMVEQGNYNIRTSNHLYGGQLGGRWRRSRGRFGWDMTGLGGIFGNDSEQSQSVIDFPNVALRPSVTNSSGTVAFVGQGNLSGFYRVTDVWYLRAGYNVLWIGGLALAPDQLDFNFAAAQGGRQLDNGGSMFLHGVNVGVEARW